MKRTVMGFGLRSGLGLSYLSPKLPALKIALDARILNVIVTDTETAEALLSKAVPARQIAEDR